MKDYETRVTINDLKDIGNYYKVELRRYDDNNWVAICNNKFNLEVYKEKISKFIILSGDIKESASGMYYFIFN